MFTNKFLHNQKSLILLISMLLTSCATTNKNNVAIDSDDIVISEEFGIDTELRKKFEQAVELMRSKDYKTAIELLIEVTDNTKKHSAPYVNLAIAYSETGKMKKAEKVLLRAKKINPRHPVTNNELGLLYRKTGRFSKAKKRMKI